MKLHSLALCALLAAAGCEKTNDVGRLQDEANLVVKRNLPVFEELAKREDEMRQHLKTAPAPLQGKYDDARAKTTQARAMLAQAPTAITTATSTGNPEELEKLIDTMRERLEVTEMEIRANLTTVENALAGAEQSPKVADQAPASGAAAAE